MCADVRAQYLVCPLVDTAVSVQRIVKNVVRRIKLKVTTTDGVVRLPLEERLKYGGHRAISNQDDKFSLSSHI
jgi:hypothetical protein